MVEIITALLTSVGFITCIIFGYALLETIFMFIVKSVQQLKYKHEYEHRFDKPPIAKCYCVDCAYYSKDSGICLCHDGWVMNDTDFCSEAYPRKEKIERMLFKMGDSNLFEADYERYCQLCEYKDLEEFKDPCNECLCNSVMEGTRKPMHFKEVKNE